MKKHLMLDLETLDKGPRSAVISIGACIFDANGITDTFKVNIKPESAKAFGMTVGKDTLNWWAKQSEEARQASLTKNVMADFGLQTFIDWVGKHRPDYIWAHGVVFDIVIIEHAFSCVAKTQPWSYGSVMDSRTLFNLFGIKTKDLHSTANTTHHDALDDAKTQANGVIAVLRSMGWGEDDSPLKI